MAEMTILHRGKIALVPERNYSLEEMGCILKKIRSHPGIFIEIRKVKKRNSLLVTIKTLRTDVWEHLESLADDFGEEIKEIVSGRSVAQNYVRGVA